MLKGVNNQSDADSNKRRSGIAESSNARRSDGARTTAQGLEWKCGVEHRSTEHWNDNQVIILGATFIVASS